MLVAADEMGVLGVTRVGGRSGATERGAGRRSGAAAAWSGGGARRRPRINIREEASGLSRVVEWIAGDLSIVRL